MQFMYVFVYVLQNGRRQSPPSKHLGLAQAQWIGPVEACILGQRPSSLKPVSFHT